MKTYKNLYRTLKDISLIEECIWTASKDKRNRPPVKKVIENREWYSAQILQMLENKTYSFKNYPKKIINEGSNKKERIIVTPLFYPDQVIHHLIMYPLKPIIFKSMYEHAYGSIEGRSPLVAIKQLRKWVDSYQNKNFYVLKCDIRQFFGSIDHNVLKRKIQRKVNDSDYLDLVFSLIDSYDEGVVGKAIPKGFYTSQWFSHLYLTDFDHYIKHELGAKHYMRYADDIIVLDTNKRRLRKIFNKMQDYLNNQLFLEFKDNWQIYRFVDKNGEHGRDIDFIGYRLYRDKTTIRKSHLRQINRKANHLEKKREDYKNGNGQGVTVHDAQSMLSYLGRTKHADVYHWYQGHIKPRINKRRLRKQVSKADKKKNKEIDYITELSLQRRKR